MIFRNTDCSYSTFHGVERPPGPGVNRDAFCLLHGSECRHLPALRLITHDRKTLLADGLVSRILLPDLCYVRTGVAAVSPWQAQDPHPLRVRASGDMYTAAVSPHCDPDPEARVLGGALDASHPVRIHLPKCFPSWVHLGSILCQVRDIFGHRGGGVCSVQCTC